MGKKKDAGNGAIILLGVAALILFTKKDSKAPAGSSKPSGSTKVPAQSAIEFLTKLKPYAVALGKKIGVPYLFIMAQIALETAFGRSFLFYKYFNVGGIKAKPGQKFVEAMTWEYVKDPAKYPRRDKTKDKFDSKTKLWKIRTPEKFAIYDNLADGLVGYSGILLNKYFKKYAGKTQDPKKYVALIQSNKPRYATDINYIPKIHKLIDTAAKV